MNDRNAHRNHRGFTIIEVLISFSILVMIMTLLYGSFSVSLRAPNEIGAIQDRYIALGRAMDRMAREISGAYLSMHYNAQYEDSPKTIFKLNDNRLDFTTFGHLKIVKDADESDQAEISYFLEDDKEDHSIQNIMRRESPRINYDPEHGGTIYKLLDDVIELRLRAWNGEEWVEEWDTTKVEYLNRLPERIKIEVIIYDENGERRTFVTETKLRLLQPLKFG